MIKRFITYTFWFLLGALCLLLLQLRAHGQTTKPDHSVILCNVLPDSSFIDCDEVIDFYGDDLSIEYHIYGNTQVIVHRLGVPPFARSITVDATELWATTDCSNVKCSTTSIAPVFLDTEQPNPDVNLSGESVYYQAHPIACYRGNMANKWYQHH